MLARAGGAASPRVRAIVVFYAGWRDAWTTHRPGIAANPARRCRGVPGRRRSARVAMATTTAGVAEINSAAPDVAAATGWLGAGAEAFRAAHAGWGECLAFVALGRIALLAASSMRDGAFPRGAAASQASARGSRAPSRSTISGA
jgi:hypothetical protein